MGLAYSMARTAMRSHSQHKPSTGQHTKPDPSKQIAQIQQARAIRAAKVEADLAALRETLKVDSFIAPKHARVETEPEPEIPLNPNRPRTLDDMVGQTELLTQLRIVINGSLLRDKPMPNCLISGPPGYGKTTLAQVIAEEMDAKLITTSGIVMRKPQDLAGLLVKMEPNSVFFCDEIHALPTAVMEMLYEALEDNKVSLLVGSGSDTTTQTFALPRWICVGATTRPGLLTKPFRDRFGFTGVMDTYTTEDLATIVDRAWKRSDTEFHEGEPLEVAKRCKGVPRLALHLSERVLDYAAVRGNETICQGLTDVALATFGVDENGLDRTDWKILDALVNRFGGRTVGIDALAQFLDLDKKTLTDQYEGPLVQSGLMHRTASGRMATPEAYALFQTEGL